MRGLPSPPPWPGLYTLVLTDLPAATPRPQLLDHHLLMLFTAGHGRYSVDFVSRPCRPGTLVWARPGQAIQHGHWSGPDAVLLGWRADLLALPEPAEPAPYRGTAHRHWQLTGEDEDAIINEVSQLVVDCERYRDGDLPGALLRHQLAELLLRIAALPAAVTGPSGGRMVAAGDDMFARFRREVELRYLTTRRVEDYAALLGCSVRTLTRASLAATGISAKQFIDDRAALQARRLLACTDLPVAVIGARLGFAEPTNFGRFFHREVGCSPGAFRARTPGVGLPAPRAESELAGELPALAVRPPRAPSRRPPVPAPRRPLGG